MPWMVVIQVAIIALSYLAQYLLRPKPPTPAFKAMTSAWGDTWPIVYNNFRIPGKVIQAGDVTRHDGKKKGGPPSFSQTFAIGFCEGVKQFGRIWADNNVIYDPREIVDPPVWKPNTVYGAGDIVLAAANDRWQFTASVNGTSGGTTPTWDKENNAVTRDGSEAWIASRYKRRRFIGKAYNYTVRLYTGSEDQLPDAALEEIVGTGRQPAYRGLAYAVFENFSEQRYGNRIPNIEAEFLAEAINPGPKTREVQLTYFGNRSYNAPGNTLDFYFGTALTQVDGFTGDIIRTVTIPSQVTTQNVIYGWDKTYAYSARIKSGAGFGVFFYRVRVSDFSWVDTISFVLPYDYGADGNLAPNMAISKTGRYVAALGVDFTGVVDLTLFIHDYQTNTSVQIPHLSAETKSNNIAFDDNDTIWILKTPNFLPYTMLNYSTAGVLLASYSFSPANPGSYMTGIRLMISVPDQNKIFMPGYAISAADNLAGKSDTYIWDAVTHSISSEWGRNEPFVDDGRIEDDLPFSIYLPTTWSDLGKFCFTGYNPTSAAGEIAVVDINTKTTTLYPLTQWASVIPGLDGTWEYPDATTANPTIYDQNTNSFVSASFTPNFDESYVVLGATGGGALTLADICADVSGRVGLTDDDHDYSGLSTVIPKGAAILQRDSARSFIESLQLAFFFDLVDIGVKLIGNLRSQSANIVTIPEADLAANEDPSQIVDKITTQRGMDLEIPQDLSVNYYDFDHDYQAGSQQAKRSRTTQSSTGRNTLQFPVVMKPGEAADAAARALHLLWMERDQKKLNLPLEYIKITATDIVTAIRATRNHILRVAKATLDPAKLIIAIEGVSEDTGVYSISAAPPLSDLVGGSFQGQTITPVLAPILVLLDTATLRQPDLTAPGVYLAGCRSDPDAQWTGETVVESQDDSVFDKVLDIDIESTIGIAQSILGDCPRWTVWDNTNFLLVKMKHGALGNASKSDVVNNFTNTFWMSSGEIFQAAMATLIATDPTGDTYRLSVLLRGRFGTEAFVGMAVGGETVVFLDESTMQNATYAASEIGATRYWKGTNDSADGSDSGVIITTSPTRRLLPFAPYFLRGTRDMSGNLTITGLRRMRWRGSPLWRPAETDTPVTMQIDIKNGVTVVRTLTATLSGAGSGITNASAFTAYYAAADQVTDFGSTQASLSIIAYELNATIGRGYGGKGTV